MINFVGVDGTFHLTGSVSAIPGTYSVGFDYYQGSVSSNSNGFSLADGIVITGSGEVRLFSASAVQNFVAGAWNARASVDSTDCGFEFSSPISTTAAVTQTCPTVSTAPAVASGTGSITMFANTLSTGDTLNEYGYGIVQRGFVFSSTDPLPSITGSSSYNLWDGILSRAAINQLVGWSRDTGFDAGGFESIALTSSTTYYIRAWLSGSGNCGVSYGNVVTERTADAPAYNAVGQFFISSPIFSYNFSAATMKASTCANPALADTQIPLYFRKYHPDQKYPWTSVGSADNSYPSGQETYFDEAMEINSSGFSIGGNRNWHQGGTNSQGVTVPAQLGTGNAYAQVDTNLLGMTGSIGSNAGDVATRFGNTGLTGNQLFIAFGSSGRTVKYSDCNNREYQPNTAIPRSHKDGTGVI